MVKPGWAKRQCPVTFWLSAGKPIEYLRLGEGIIAFPGDSKGSHSEHSPMRRRKGMSDAPTTVYNVPYGRNAGWPTSRERYGHGVIRVVSGWESQLQGEG